MLSHLLLPLLLFSRLSRCAIGSLKFDGCDNTQQQKIVEGVKEAIVMAGAAADSVLMWESAASYEFFGPVLSYGGRDPHDAPSTILNMFDSVKRDKFAISAYCFGTGDQAMKELCGRKHMDVHFGDVVGLKDGPAPGIKLVFCEAFFTLPSLKERMEFVSKELMWWAQHDLDYYWRNTATSVLHELIHLGFQTRAQTSNIWMKVNDNTQWYETRHLKGQPTYVGAYGPLAAKVLARTKSETWWAALNANNYAMFALADRLGNDWKTKDYKYLPLVDRPLIQPASSIPLSSPVVLDGDKWSFDGKVYTAYMVHQRYIATDAPDLNVGVKRGRLADLTGSRWYGENVLTPRYTNLRNNEVQRHLDGLRGHNTWYWADYFPDVADTARTCIKQPNAPDPAAPHTSFDRNDAMQVIEKVCVEWPEDVLLVPKIFGGTDRTVDGKNRSAFVLKKVVLQGVEGLIFYIGMIIADECSIPVWVKDAFFGERGKCIAAYREIIDWCDPGGLRKFGGSVTLNCIKLSIEARKRDAPALDLHAHMGALQCPLDVHSQFLSPGGPNSGSVFPCYLDGIPKVKALFCVQEDHAFHIDQDAVSMQRAGMYC